MKSILIFASLLICDWFTLVALAAPPKLLPFQGRLTDTGGTPLSNGSRIVQFQIYDAPAGGTRIWQGEVQRLTINGGLVSTLLGSKASLDAVDFNSALYLEITVDANADDQITVADPPLLPRQSVLPAVFAVEAATAQRATLAQNAEKLGGFGWDTLVDNGNPSTGKIPIARIAIPPGSVPSNAIATDDSITGNQLAPNSIGNSELSDGAVTTAKIASAAVTRDKIGNKEVTALKLSTRQIVDGTQVSAVGDIVSKAVTNGIPIHYTNEIDTTFGNFGSGANVTITTGGGPIFVGLTGADIATAVENLSGSTTIRPQNSSNIFFTIQIDGVRGSHVTMAADNLSGNVGFPYSSVWFLVPVTAGQHNVIIRVSSHNTTIVFGACKMIIYELH